MNNKGIIYRTDNEFFGVAYDHEQKEEFRRYSRILVHLYHDRRCCNPVYNGRIGIKPPVLKNSANLEMVGFTDECNLPCLQLSPNTDLPNSDLSKCA